MTPYAYIPDHAYEALPKLSHVAAKVMVALAGFMPGNNSVGCFPSLAAIGERAGIARGKTITLAIKELVAKGVLVCEHRRRQTNIFKWAIQGSTLTALPNSLGKALTAPLDPNLKKGTYCQVERALSAPRKDTRKDTNTTTSLLYTQNAEKPPRRSAHQPNENDAPTSKDKPKGKSFPQGNQTPPPLPPAPAAEPGKRKARPKPNQHPAWLLWLRVNRDAGQPIPLEEKASLAAARKLAEQIPDPEEQEAVMLAYIGDKADAWAIRQGLTLSVLVNSRLSKCRAAAARVVEEQAADDAELIRGAAETFPDPDERADFFYQRSVRGLRVPPGVDCRPMPAEKEVAV